MNDNMEKSELRKIIRESFEESIVQEALGGVFKKAGAAVKRASLDVDTRDLQDKFNENIKTGDKFFNNKQYDIAIRYYGEAQKLMQQKPIISSKESKSNLEKKIAGSRKMLDNKRNAYEASPEGQAEKAKEKLKSLENSKSQMAQSNASNPDEGTMNQIHVIEKEIAILKQKYGL